MASFLNSMSKLGAKANNPHFDGTYLYLWHIPSKVGFVEVHLELNWVTHSMEAMVGGDARLARDQFVRHAVANYEVSGNDAFVLAYQGDVDGKAVTILLKDNGKRVMGMSRGNNYKIELGWGGDTIESLEKSGVYNTVADCHGDNASAVSVIPDVGSYYDDAILTLHSSVPRYIEKQHEEDPKKKHAVYVIRTLVKKKGEVLQEVEVEKRIDEFFAVRKPIYMFFKPQPQLYVSWIHCRYRTTVRANPRLDRTPHDSNLRAQESQLTPPYLARA